MKTSFFIAIIGTILSACGNENNNATEQTKQTDSSTLDVSSSTANSQQPAAVNEAVTAYLQLKNALTNDNSKEAAEAGKQLQESIQKVGNASLAANQKKVYDEIKEDLNEHAEHISTNADKIAHQREHFDMLSKDMYDLVKAVKPGQTLYKVHCPMFNNNKGAIWLSEVKEIKNPYYGKKMLTCGEEQEEIK